MNEFRPDWCSCGHPAFSHKSTPPNECERCGCEGFNYDD